jgi:tRNA G18 (ribose-2'-O)-methylase SpoU
MLVIGSEGTGVSPHLMALSDETIMIKKLGSD